MKAFNELKPQDLYGLLKLRCSIFVVEQHAAYLDLDGLDQLAHHLFLSDSNGQVIACCRLLPPGTLYAEASIGRVAVSPEHRGQGLGHDMMLQALSLLDELFGSVPIHISAQKYLERFYASHGFETVTGEYLEDGIVHVGMVHDSHPENAESRLAIRYLGHSAFLVETAKRCILFDYGDHPARAQHGLMREGVFNPAELADKPLFILSSHQHGDHYSKTLHQFAANRADTWFVMGLDEAPSCAESPLEKTSTSLAWPHATLTIEDMTIHCSGSTDCGVSFLIEMPEAVIYHGGDLALWDDQPYYRKVYRQEVGWLTRTVNSRHLAIDLAFLPVSTSDGYQEQPLLEGLAYWADNLGARYIVPMHGHGYEQLYSRFADWAQTHGFGRTMVLARPGQAASLDLSENIL